MDASVSFEQSLEHCLQALARTGDVEASLRRYPQYADELRPLLEMAQATRRYYRDVPQAPGGLADGRQRTLAVAAQQRAKGSSASPGARSAPTKRPKVRLVFATRSVAFLMAIVVGLFALGGGVIWAASASLPGDLFYPVKLATEEIRLTLAATPGDRAELELRFVEERAQEIERLVATGRQIPNETLDRMERHVERALTQVAWAADDKTVGLLARVATRTQAQQQTLEQVQATAPRELAVELSRAVDVCRLGVAAAQEGLRDPSAFRWRYRQQQGAPAPTQEPGQVTATPGGDEEKGRDRSQPQDPKRELTPSSTPSVIPPSPQTTPKPSATSRGLRATSEPPGILEPAATPKPQVTSEPPVTPRGPGPTAKPQATPQGPGGMPGGSGETPKPPKPGGGPGDGG